MAGFFLMQIALGVVAMFALLANHVGEDSLFVLPDEKGFINCSRGEHQSRTTDDFSPDSALVSFFFCGLNHHVATTCFHGIATYTTLPSPGSCVPPLPSSGYDTGTIQSPVDCRRISGY